MGPRHAKITTKLVTGLQPAASQYEVTDTELPGFRVRVMPSGVKTFSVVYRTHDGERRRYSLGRYGVLTVKQARNNATDQLAAARTAKPGEDPQAAKKAAQQAAKMPTLEEFAGEESDYGKWVAAHHKSEIKTLHRLRVVFKEFGDTRLDRITAWNVEKWRAARLKKGLTGSTVNRDVDTLKACLNKALEWGLIKVNPIAGVKRVKAEDENRVRWLSYQEEKRLRKALVKAPDYLRDMTLLVMNTGLRRGELFQLTARDVDLERRTLTVRAAYAKASKVRHIPLNNEAMSVVRVRAKADGLLFPGKDGAPMTDIKKSWATLMAAAKITDFRFHDLRHHFASKLVMAGVDLNTVRELLGHADIKMTLRYSHLAPEHKAEAVARLMGAK